MQLIGAIYLVVFLFTFLRFLAKRSVPIICFAALLPIAPFLVAYFNRTSHPIMAKSIIILYTIFYLIICFLAYKHF